jgi:hypothetical protein
MDAVRRVGALSAHEGAHDTICISGVRIPEIQFRERQHTTPPPLSHLATNQPVFFNSRPDRFPQFNGL